MTIRTAWQVCLPFLLTCGALAATALLIRWTVPVLVLRQSPAAIYPVAIDLNGRCMVVYRLQEVTTWTSPSR